MSLDFTYGAAFMACVSVLVVFVNGIISAS